MIGRSCDEGAGNARSRLQEKWREGGVPATKEQVMPDLVCRRTGRPEARSDENYTLKVRFENRVYAFKDSGARSDEKIYTGRLIRKSCL